MDNISIIIRNKNEAEFIGFAIQSCLDFFDRPQIIVILQDYEPILDYFLFEIMEQIT